MLGAAVNQLLKLAAFETPTIRDVDQPCIVVCMIFSKPSCLVRKEASLKHQVRSFVLILTRDNGSEPKKCARVMMGIISEVEEWLQSSIVTTIHLATA